MSTAELHLDEVKYCVCSLASRCMETFVSFICETFVSFIAQKVWTLWFNLRPPSIPTVASTDKNCTLWKQWWCCCWLYWQQQQQQQQQRKQQQHWWWKMANILSQWVMTMLIEDSFDSSILRLAARNNVSCSWQRIRQEGSTVGSSALSQIWNT